MVTPMLNTKKCNLIYPFGKLRMLLFEMIPFSIHQSSRFSPPYMRTCPMTGFLYPHSTTFLFIFEFFAQLAHFTTQLTKRDNR